MLYLLFSDDETASLREQSINVVMLRIIFCVLPSEGRD